MRSPITLVVLPAAALILAACAAPTVGSEIPTEADQGSAQVSDILTDDYEGAIPVMAQLILGTFQLDGTELGVTAAQAAEMLPLWRAVRSLSNSDTAAEVEIEAVVDQIGASLTKEQLRAIAEMQLTPEDLFETIRELGVVPQVQISQGEEGQLGLGPGPIVGDFVGAPPDGAAGGGPPGGGFTGGQGPGGPDGGVFSPDLSPDQIATLEAQRESGEGPAARMALILIDPLIELLEKTAAASPTP